MCKFPKGNADFKEIREEGLVYIDKTKYIEILENSSNKSVHFLRPRRFGKSLFTSMLECYYDVNMADSFDKLFQGTYIHARPTKKRNQSYVLKFNFAGLGGKHGEELERVFDKKVHLYISAFCEKYGFENKIPSNYNGALALFNLIQILRNKIKDHKVYVLIDEYDNFANDMLSFDLEEFANATQSDGFVRSFYEELKNGTDGVIERIFITGVSPITLDSMTSGFNISTNLSLDPRFNEALGFTTAEMQYLISLVDTHEAPEDTLKKMKGYYNGYRFSEDATNYVYNPNMALYYLDYIQSFHKEPKSLIDPNIYSDYNRIKNLLRIKPNQEQSDALLEIITNGKIECPLTLSYNLQKDFTKNDFISLLYYLGYLTIYDYNYDGTIFKVPNDVIQDIYFDYFVEMLKENYQVYSNEYTLAIKQILDDQKNDNLVSCIEKTLVSMDNRDFINFNEKIIKAIITNIFTPSRYIRLKNEYPVEKGYIDLALFPEDNRKPIILIELKYIKSGDFNEVKLQEKREEAYKQLLDYGSAKEFKEKNIIKWILIFSKGICVLNETIL